MIYNCQGRKEEKDDQLELFSGVSLCIFFYLAVFLPMKMGWWLTLALTENYVYGWNYEGGVLKKCFLA